MAASCNASPGAEPGVVEFEIYGRELDQPVR